MAAAATASSFDVLHMAPQVPSKCKYCDTRAFTAARWAKDKFVYTIQCRGPKAHILDHYGGKWIHTNKRLKLVRGQADQREQPPTSQAAHCDALMSSTPTSVPIHALGDFAEALADAKARNMVLARQKRDKETELATQEAKSNAAQAKVEESKDKLKWSY